MRLLVWPESSDGMPLEPEESGWVVGWKLDDATVVCAGILPKERNDIDADIIVGRWEPGDASSTTTDSIPCIISTVDGPWWKDASSDPPEEQQLMLYRRNGVHYQDSTPWMSGVFPRLLWHLNEASSVMERLERGESISVDFKDNTDERSNKSSTAEQDEPAVESGQDDASLPGRLRRLVAKQSMLLLHYCKSSRGGFYHIPVIQLFLLLIRKKEDASGVRFSRRDQVTAFIERFNETASIALNMILGVLAGVLLLYYTEEALSLLQQAWRGREEHLLRDNIQWLETFPVGFKLNVPLTQNMGREILMLIDVHDSISDWLWSFISKTIILRSVGAVSLVFGLTTLLALLHDIWILSTLHIATVATCFRAMHRTQLYLLASLWRLFRGRKKNILRHRTDTMEYDSMQLLIGMILFTAVLFLFTTVFVYYTFFVVIDLIIHAVGVTLWFLYVLVRFLPLGKCFLRAKYPGWFTERVFLGDVVSKSRTVTRLVPVCQSFSSILSDALVGHLSAVIASIPRYIIEVLTGKPCSIRHVRLSKG